MSQYGFIGLGNMGFPMATNLVKAGHEVHVVDMNPAVIERAKQVGMHPRASLRELGDMVEIIFLSLPKGDNVHAVASLSHGLVVSKKAKVVIDFSTIGPAAAVKASEIFAQGNIVYLDSPVSGGTLGAARATLAIMTSCARSEYDKVVDILKVLGKPFHVGDEPGMAQTMKLANNMLSAGALALTSEVFAMGVKNGLDPKVMLDVINVGSGQNTATSDKFPRAVLPRTFDIGFAAVLAHKDLKLCVDEGESLGIPMVIGSAVKELYVMTIAKYGQQADMSDVARLMESWTGVEIKKT
jgi:3-hydroxyisobutyrate dehydrogenase